MFMTSYLCKSPARDHNISDNGRLKHENNFHKVQIKNFDQVVGFPIQRLKCYWGSCLDPIVRLDVIIFLVLLLIIALMFWY